MANKDASGQACELIYRFYKFLKEQRNMHTIAFRDTVEVFGIDGKTLKRFINYRGNEEMDHLKKKLPLKKRETITASQYQEIRHIIMNTHVQEKSLPELNFLVKKLNSPTVYAESLKKNLLKMGFRVCRNRYVLESKKNRQQRLTYLKAIKQAKSEGKTIVYLFVKCERMGTNKRRSFTLAQAATPAGFMPRTLRVFRSLRNVHHKKSTSHTLLVWLKSTVMKNLPPDSLFVLDQESHKMLTQDTPKLSYSKENMLQWLSHHDIYVDKDLLKPEIYEIIKRHRSNYFEFEFGLPAIKLPKHDKFLNPLEGVWSILFDRALTMISIESNDMQRISPKLEEEITSEHWEAGLSQAVMYEDSFLEEEAVLEKHWDDMISRQILLAPSEHEEGEKAAKPEPQPGASNIPLSDDDLGEKFSVEISELLTDDVDLTCDEE